MQFGMFGGFVQLESGSECDTLWRAGLVHKSGNDWRPEIEPTEMLRSLFDPMPELEELYPVLVEFVLIYRFPNAAGFIDQQEVGRKLGELGLTAAGLVTLRERISRVVTRRP